MRVFIGSQKALILEHYQGLLTFFVQKERVRGNECRGK